MSKISKRGVRIVVLEALKQLEDIKGTAAILSMRVGPNQAACSGSEFHGAETD